MTERPGKALFIPLDDAPRDHIDPFNSARLELTRNMLLEQLRRMPCQHPEKGRFFYIIKNLWSRISHIISGKKDEKGSGLHRSTHNTKAHDAACIGLFGGLGQGKSSVVLQALGELIKEKPGFRYYFFDITRFRPTQLEYEFDEIAGGWKAIWQRFTLTVFLLFFLSTLIFIYLGSSNIDASNSSIPSYWWNKFFSSSGLFLVISGTLTLFLRKRFGQWLRDFGYKCHLHGARDAIKWAMDNLFINPDLIIIDNLDRASLPQQRALLRSLHRYNQSLPHSFIICMDETVLLADQPDPEAPEELLRKVIPVELHLPARVPEDATALSMGILHDCRGRNETLAILNDPMFIADFCTLVSLQPCFSPRSVKRLLNDSLMHAAELRVIDCAEDTAALVKYHLCLALFPETRNTPHRLTHLLEGRERLSDEQRQRQFDNLIDNTRSIIPLDGQWRRLIGGFGTAMGLVPQQTSLNLSLKFFLYRANAIRSSNRDFYVDLWIRLDAIRGGYGDSEYRDWLPHDLQTSTMGKALTLIHACVMLAHTADPRQRLRLHRFLWKSMEEDDSVKRIKHMEYMLRRMEYMLLRRCLGDDDVMKLTGGIEGQNLPNILSRLEPAQVLYLLPLLPKEHLPFGKALRYLVSSNIEGSDIKGEELEVATLRRWLRQQEMAMGSEVISYISSADCSLINRIWPPIAPVCRVSGDGHVWADQLKQHLAVWRTMLIIDGLRPDSLACWFNNAANWQAAAKLKLPNKKRLLDSLASLFRSSDEDWDLELWSRLEVDDLQHVREFLLSIPRYQEASQRQNECALVLRCLVIRDKPMANILPHPITSPGLLRLICQSERLGKAFWKTISVSQAEIMLPELLKSKDFQSFAPEIKRFIDGNPEKIGLLDFLGLEPILEE